MASASGFMNLVLSLGVKPLLGAAMIASRVLQTLFDSKVTLRTCNSNT
jgi:small nuclear ribonucleoprotein (snRNP)-like protein